MRIQRRSGPGWILKEKSHKSSNWGFLSFTLWVCSILKDIRIDILCATSYRTGRADSARFAKPAGSARDRWHRIVIGIARDR